MARVFTSQRADDDLEAIWLYIATDSVRAADRWLDVLMATAQRLAERPGLGRARPDLLPDLAPDLRSFPVAAYLLFYRPVSDGIELIRVLHGAQDVGPALTQVE